MSRWHVAVMAVLGLAGCSREPSTVEPEPAAAPLAVPAEAVWTTASPDGQAYLQLRAGEPCTLVCVTAAKQEAWALQGCLATANDLRFVSNDCRTAALLYPAPKKNGSWAATVVARVVRDGVLARELVAGEIPGVDSASPRFRWLAGTLGELGHPPHYAADGKAVELEVMTRRGREPREIGLEARAVPQGPAASGPRADGPDTALYQWEDEDGDVQVSQGLASIPKKFRAKAKPISADLAVISPTRPKKKIAVAPPTNEAWLRANFPRMPSSPEAASDATARPSPKTTAPAVEEEPAWRPPPPGLPVVDQWGIPAYQPPPTNKDLSCREGGQACHVPLDCCSGHCNVGSCE